VINNGARIKHRQILIIYFSSVLKARFHTQIEKQTKL
jgi:hypothetical protein